MDLCLAFWALDRTSTPKHPKIFPTGPHFFYRTRSTCKCSWSCTSTAFKLGGFSHHLKLAVNNMGFLSKRPGQRITCQRWWNFLGLTCGPLRSFGSYSTARMGKWGFRGPNEKSEKPRGFCQISEQSWKFQWHELVSAGDFHAVGHWISMLS